MSSGERRQLQGGRCTVGAVSESQLLLLGCLTPQHLGVACDNSSRKIGKQTLLAKAVSMAPPRQHRSVISMALPMEHGPIVSMAPPREHRSMVSMALPWSMGPSSAWLLPGSTTQLSVWLFPWRTGQSASGIAGLCHLF